MKLSEFQHIITLEALYHTPTYHVIIYIVQALIDQNIIQGNHCLIIQYTLSQLRNMEGVVNLTKVLR